MNTNSIRSEVETHPRVMIVDDDEAVRKTVGRVLRRACWEVVVVPSGQDCLRALRKNFSGIILMDISMPGLTGWQTIRAIVDENLMQRVLICMLTTRTSPGGDGQGLEQFVFDYLPKPFESSVLLRCLENAVDFLEA